LSPLFWIDVIALTACALAASSLGFMVLSLGPRRAVNRSFFVFALSYTAWVFLSLTLRVHLRLGARGTQTLLELCALAISLAAPALLLFARRYTGSTLRAADATAAVAYAATAALALPLFHHRLIHGAALLPSGASVNAVTPLGAVAAVVPLGCLVFAAALFWRQSVRSGEWDLTASALLLAATFVADGVLQVPLPLLSVGNAIAIGLIGYAVLRRQLMNPLRELSDDLERKVAERSRQLEAARLEVEQRVEERTAQLQREIADRRHAEEVLRESEEKFRNLAEQSPNMIFINSGGRVVYANRVCEAVTGYSREEFYSTGFDIRCLFSPESLPTVNAAFAAHRRGDEVPPYEYTIVARDGRRIEAINASRLIRYEGQSATLGVITDIGGRKRQERLLAGLNDVALEMTAAATPDEGLIAATATLANLGLSAAVYMAGEGGSLELRRKAGPDSFAPPSVLPLTPGSPAGEAVARHRPVVVAAADLPCATPIAPGAVGAVAMAPLLLESGNAGLLLVAGPDLAATDLHAIAAYANLIAASWRKARLLEQLEESLQQLRRAQDQLVQSQKMEAIGRLAGGLAHDFNNILTAITGYTELAIAGSEAVPAVREDLAEIRQAADRAAGLTRQLLTFSRKQVLQPTTVDLNALVSGMSRMLRRLIPEDIAVSTLLAPTIGAVRADPGQIEQVVLNLALNARDAMARGGLLVIGTADVDLDEQYSERYPDVRPGPYVMLSVSDTGVGMAPETQQHIFEPFFTTKATGTGTGLGLATVYGIVTQSDGHIAVESEPGKGARFRVYLPRLAAAPPEAPAEATAAQDGDGTETVLVVEDEPVLRSLVSRVLARNGYRVLAASEAGDAIKQADAHPGPIHLMVTDVVMPGPMNGRDLARYLETRRPRMRVIYTSGYAENAVLHGGALEPGLAFLPKPFDPASLVEKVRSVLRQPPVA
jgi:PAS domain S-box-containing protein